MWSNLTKMDRFGVLVCAGLLFAVIFLWWIGWAGWTALLVALLAVALFLFVVIWIGTQNDDDETNDSAAAALAEMRTEAKSAWLKAREAVQGTPKQ